MKIITKLILLTLMSIALNSFAQSSFQQYKLKWTKADSLLQQIRMNKMNNSKDLLIGEVVFYWSGGGNWNLSDTIVYTYDTNNNNTVKLAQIQTWNVSGYAWRNHWRYIYTYDMNNRVISQLYQTWDVSNNTWNNSGSYCIYTYDVNNNLTEEVYMDWDTNSNTFVNTRKYIFTENETIEGQDWDKNSNSWVFSYKIRYYNDYQQNWDKNSNSWVNDICGQVIKTYDANKNLTSEKIYGENILYGYCEEIIERSYTYDVNNNLTSFTYEYLNRSGGRDIVKDTYSYDADNNRIEELEESTEPGGFNLQLKYLTKYYYKKVSGINEKIDDIEQMVVYPNPTKGKFTVTMEVARMGEGKIAVYNVLGERVYSATHLQITKLSNYQIDLSALPAGIYFLQVNTGEEIVNRKLVLEK